jgi:hypothetical protein
MKTIISDILIGIAFLMVGIMVGLFVRGRGMGDTKVTTTKVRPDSLAYKKRVIRPLHGVSMVYVAELDTTYKPTDTVVIMSPSSGEIIKAVVVR